MIVQCLGVFTTYVVISQLALAEAMPFPYYILTSTVVGTGVISNFLNYFGMLPPVIWGIWEDFITVGGLSVLPQVLPLVLYVNSQLLILDPFRQILTFFCMMNAGYVVHLCSIYSKQHPSWSYIICFSHGSSCHGKIQILPVILYGTNTRR